MLAPDGQVFSATAFQSTLPNGMATGTLTVTYDLLRFESAAGKIDMRLNSVQMRAGGHNDQQIFFESPLHPGVSICTSDQNLLQHPALIANPQFAKPLEEIRKRQAAWSKGWIVVGVVFLALIGLIVWIVSQRDRIVRSIADRLPLSLEQKLGDTLFGQIKKEGKVIDDPQLTKQLRLVTNRLLPAVTNVGYVFQFHIMEDTNINAFAMPGGHVVVNTGLLRAAGRPEELAGVLAHELAHVTQRHAFRKIIDSAGLTIILRAVVGDTSGLESVLSEGTQLLIRQKYSRDFEREADAVGWHYLVSANINPRGMIDFFQKLKVAQEQNSALPSTFALLNTHPATDERIQRLEANWAAMERKSGFVEFIKEKL